MDSFFTRYRNLLVLLAFLLVQIMGLAVQVRRTPGGTEPSMPQDHAAVRLIRLWAESLVAPSEKLVHYSKLGVARPLAGLH